MTPNMSRTASPWSGSEYGALLDWELDDADSLLAVADRFTAIGEQLLAAHLAGWTLTSAMSGGRLHARRQSRRQRGRSPSSAVEIPAGDLAPALRWRLRVVDEGRDANSSGLTAESADATPWLIVRGGELSQLAGPEVDEDILAQVRAQIGPAEAGDRRWALVSARVGPAMDLVAEHSRLRHHAVVDGVVLRTVETLGYRHTADGVMSLPVASAAYRRLAAAAMAMHRAGGRLTAVDDGFVIVGYPE